MHHKYDHATRGTALLGLCRGSLPCFGLALLLCSPRMAAAQSVTWSETWEAGQGSWSIAGDSPHVWEVGVPTAGPSSPHGGTQCAGTILAGNYPGSADSRLISPPLTLAASPPGGKLWLSFWQWFQLTDGDRGSVEISTDNGVTWTQLSRSVTYYSGDVWTRRLEDVSAYAGQTVRVAFRMVSGMWGGNVPGWSVDDVEVLQGPLEAWSPEGFEDGLGGWSADRGVWEVGVPTAGPSSPHGGTQCAGTILAGNYPGSADSRLISPPLTLAASPPGGELWLSFWQWFQLSDGDWGSVEISDDNGSTWTQIGPLTSGSSDGWVLMGLDISNWIGRTVRVAFHMVSGMWGGNVPGWSVDDIDIIGGTTTGVEPPKPPSEHVAALSLSPPAPNPAHGAFAISFALPEEQDIRIVVLEPGGRCVATIADGHYASGTHQVRWSAPNGGGLGLSSGVYFVRLMAGGETRVRKMLYLK